MKAILAILTILISSTAVAQCPNCRPIVVQPAQTIMVPRTVYQPYQLQRTTIQPRWYGTPVRRWLFGTHQIQHQYAPVQRQQDVPQTPTQ